MVNLTVKYLCLFDDFPLKRKNYLYLSVLPPENGREISHTDQVFMCFVWKVESIGWLFTFREVNY